jgi:hypothetical protein
MDAHGGLYLEQPTRQRRVARDGSDDERRGRYRGGFGRGICAARRKHQRFAWAWEGGDIIMRHFFLFALGIVAERLAQAGTDGDFGPGRRQSKDDLTRRNKCDVSAQHPGLQCTQTYKTRGESSNNNTRYASSLLMRKPAAW